MMKKNKLSVVVITHNEEAMIEGCLKSIAWADEIIVIDDYSKDKTLKIAKKYTKRVFKKKFKGFASQKNYGISKARHGWILILDADERVSLDLRRRIQKLIKENKNFSYNILRKNFFLGKEMKHGGWQNEFPTRLFKNKRAKYFDQEIHEILKAKDPSIYIHEPHYHFTHRDLSSNLLKTRQYAILESRYNHERGGYPKVTAFSLIKNIIDHFIYRYIKTKGYRDGMEGFVEAVYQAFSQIFIVQAMTWERQRGKTSAQLYKELDQKLEKNNFSFQKKEISHSNGILKTMIKKINKYFIGYLIASLLIFSFIFRDLILNISTNMIDWRDYSLVVWIINHFIDVIKNQDFSNIFNGNSFYPLKGTLLFSEILWPQTLITLFFSIFTKNIITQFNLMFFATLGLNTVSIYLFWSKIFKQKSYTFFSSVLTNFSPFLFIEINHFQMISYWPFFFTLYYLFKNKKTTKDLIFLSVFLSIQFYAAVYWAIFFITILGIYYLVSYIKKENVFTLIKELFIICSLFALLVGPIFLKYSQVQKAYSIDRAYHEYVTYSAHITDYIFNGSYFSAISKTPFFKKINSFNRHLSLSPTIAVFVLSIIGFIKLKANKKRISFDISLEKNDLIFLLIALVGFVFSLGPRLSINGFYLAFPLPFLIAMKYLVIFEPIRATIRFSALFYLGLTYFAVKGLKKINRRNSFLIIIIVLSVFLLEIIPTNFKSGFNDYYPKIYKNIENNCKNDGILLEYPFEQNSKGANVVTNLRYKATQMTSSIIHKCNLVNGYAGFDPKEYTDYINQFNSALAATDSASLNQVIKQKDINFIKVNKAYMSKDKLEQLDNIDFYNELGIVISEDKEFSLIKVEEVSNE